ncbi:MAG TPA: hypothetical protein VIM30_00600 [Candidatus Limnocylindrales bacterium]|jgi:hypothetical protein
MTTLDQTERLLYHQIHPAKLAADLTAELVWLIWQRRFGLGLLALGGLCRLVFNAQMRDPDPDAKRVSLSRSS